MKWKMSARACLAASLLALSLISTAGARIITVDDDAPADFNNIQAAIDDATEGDVVEIKPGTYTGYENREIRFYGKAITVRSTNPENLDIVAATIVDCENKAQGFIFDNAEDANSVLSGLTITNGRGGEGYSAGGAIGCNGSGPLIANCIMTNNSGWGGAIGTTYSDLIIRNCIITHNNSVTWGGGIFGTRLNSLTVENCIISHNTSPTWGGGIRSTSMGPVVIKNCIITGNKSEFGGGISARTGHVSIIGCVITGNYATEAGGGIFGRNHAHLTILSSIVSDNTAPAGPEIALTETNEPDAYSDYHGQPVLVPSYSNIRGGQPEIHVEDEYPIDWGPGNIAADPCFAAGGHWGHIADSDIHVEPNDPNATWVDGDYHLVSQGGRYDPNTGSWVIESVTSACIDAGDPISPIGSELFPNGGRVNMGAYGGTAEAAKSYFGKALCETIVAGDINGDCLIDATDFALVAGNWLTDGTFPLPEQPGNPNPSDSAVGIEIDPVLTWTPGTDARLHVIYFGPDRLYYYYGAQTETTFSPPYSLSYNTTYAWRIDEIGLYGITKGPIWTFTTEEEGGGR